MTHTSLLRPRGLASALGLLTFVSLPLPVVSAQGAPGTAATIQLAFGYSCGDRFIVRNDGNQAVSAEYKATSSQDHIPLRLNSKQSVEIASASSDPVELWVNGQVVATEPKGNRACGTSASSPDVVVRPIDYPPRQEAAAPSSRVARVSSIGGTVSFEPAGSTDWSRATLNYTVTTGDRLFSDQNGRAELEVGPFTVRLSGGSDLSVSNLTDGFLQLALQQGTVRLTVYRLTPSDSVEIDTPNGALTILTPGSYFVQTSPGGGATIVSVDQGRIEVSAPGVSQLVETGRALRLAGSSPVQVSGMPRPATTGFDQWCADRDRRVTSSSATYMSPDIPGRADLDEYGRWERDAVNGPTWYPTVVEVGWVPYRFGHWAWVEPWGWIWVENEPWGFAPFHYGRWARGERGWGWVPGPIVARPYYAPALVVFVDAPRGGWGVSFGVQAWFPLGPREPFFPSYHSDQRYLREVNATNINVTNVNITNIINVQNRENVQYAHRTTAVTAVAATTFASGRTIGREAIAVDVNRMSQARIAAHPSTAPTPQAVLGGSPPVARPANAIERRPVPTGVGTFSPTPATAGGSVRPTPATPPVIQAAPAPTGATGKPVPPAPTGATGRPAPPAPVTGTSAVVAPPGAAPTAVPPVIVKRPPPLQPVPFEARQKALQQDPGRPLEPKQVENLRAGRPAGPPAETESPQHLKTEPPKKAGPPQKGGPSRKDDSTKKGEPPKKPDAPTL